jgi:SAM-dependent methyltransferase
VDTWNKLMRAFGLKRSNQKARFRSSREYWNDRYLAGGSSGPGSYSHLAEFKARILNQFVMAQDVHTVIEFGCGDGNQLALARYPSYRGYDVSQEAVTRCRRRFHEDPSKSFDLTDRYAGERADLALSLDVIFHLVEDEVFEAYMRLLFDSGERFVIIHSSNTDNPSTSQPHVRHREFTSWIEHSKPDWELLEVIPNEFPFDGDDLTTSFSDFYIFRRKP